MEIDTFHGAHNSHHHHLARQTHASDTVMGKACTVRRAPAGSSGPDGSNRDGFHIWFGTFLPKIVDSLFVCLFVLFSRGSLVKPKKVFSEFRERPLELQPRRCDLYVCTVLCL